MNTIGCTGMFVALCSMSLAACAATSGNASLRSLARGAMSGIGESSREVIRDAAALKQWWTRHAGREAGVKMPEVDFTREMVVAVTLGTRRTGGYTIEVQRTVTEADRLKVMVRKSAPAPGSMTIQVLTAPFHVVAIPRSDLKVEFVEEGPPDPKTPPLDRM
jgi:hypothetical protein